MGVNMIALMVPIGGGLMGFFSFAFAIIGVAALALYIVFILFSPLLKWLFRQLIPVLTSKIFLVIAFLPLLALAILLGGIIISPLVFLGWLIWTEHPEVLWFFAILITLAVVGAFYYSDDENSEESKSEKVNAEIESIRKIAKKNNPNLEATLRYHQFKYGAYEKMRNSD